MKGNRVASIIGRLTVAVPKGDGKSRPTSIPDSVREERRRRKAGAAADSKLIAPTKGEGEDTSAAVLAAAEAVAVAADGDGPIVLGDLVAGLVEDDADEALIAGGLYPMGKGAGLHREGAFVATGRDGRLLERDIERASGGAGLHQIDTEKSYDLADDAWKRDIMPQILDGKNVSDFVEPHVAEHIERLEREEEELLRAEQAAAASMKSGGSGVGAGAGAGAGADGQAAMGSSEAAASGSAPSLGAVLGAPELDTLDRAQEHVLADELRKRVKLHRVQRTVEKRNTRSILPRDLRPARPDGAARQLERMGMEPAKAKAKAEEMASAGRRGKKRGRETSASGRAGSAGQAGMDDSGEVVEGAEPDSKKRRRTKSRVRLDHTTVEVDKSSKMDRGLKDSRQKVSAIRHLRRARRMMQTQAKKGEGDRVILDEMPKHLFSGKRGIGKTDWR